MRLCVMIEGQEGVTWEDWLALGRATEELGLKQEAIRQAQAEISKMRIESLASKAQIEAMQKALSEMSAELSKLRAR
jgi:predicted  nucleic acid-binding Zn-ribbon protein